MLLLILSIIGGGAFAFMGVVLDTFGKQFELNFGNWALVMYIIAGVLVAFGLIAFIYRLIRRAARRNSSAGKSSIKNLPKRRR